MSKKSAEKIKLLSLDELFGGDETAVSASTYIIPKDQVVRVPLKLMHEFNGHPFRVVVDAKMAETVESVKQHGVLEPGILREDGAGGYEIIAGHRRKLASELAGYEDMPVIIRDLSDDEATVIMVDSNIHREDILPSELAKAYRMKYEALKRMNREESGRSDTALAKESGKSRNTIQRYIRLTYLCPALLQLVDEDKLPLVTASDLSYLKDEAQLFLLEIMEMQNCIPTGKQAIQLKEMSRTGKLTHGAMLQVFKKQEDDKKVSLKSARVRTYFPENYSAQQIEDIIYGLLEEWKNREENRM